MSVLALKPPPLPGLNFLIGDFLMELRCICGSEPIWGGDDDGPMSESHIISNWSCPDCGAWIEVHTGMEDEEEQIS